MSQPPRVTASAGLGAPSAGVPGALQRLALVLNSSLDPALVADRFAAALAAAIRADRCIVVEAGDPSDPHAGLLREAFTRKEALLAESASSLLVAPLFTEHHTEGAVLAERALASPFAAEELSLLAAVAPVAAAALHNARLHDRSTSDGLTGLPGRQRFTAELEDAITGGSPVALLLADVDHLKDKNDVYGRAVGDRALVELGSLLRGRVGASGTAARCGDDEFCALLPGIDPQRARDLAEEFRKAVNDRIFDEAHEGIHLTVSAGVAAFKPGEMAAALFGRAADALAAAKRAGRNRVEVAR